MNAQDSPADLQKKVLFILHRGWVEARLLAMAQRTEQLYELADAMEPIPGYLWQGRQDILEAIRSNLDSYEERYSGRCFDYLTLLDQADLPEF